MDRGSKRRRQHIPIIEPTEPRASNKRQWDWIFVGRNTCHTYADPLEPCTAYIPVPGLVMFNMSSNSFSNISADGYSTYGAAYHGIAQYAPNFGSEGLVLFFGGQTSDLDGVDISSPKRPMSQIGIFDPSTQSWYSQTASGTVLP